MEKRYTKTCPICRKEQNYSRKYDFNFAIKNDLLCQSCSKIGKHPSKETIKKLILSRKGKTPNLGIKHSNESKRKMSDSKSGKRHPMFGKKGENHPLYKTKISNIHKEKIRQSLKGINHTEEHKKKIRISTINYISKYKLNGNQLFPRFNPKAMNLLTGFNKERGWNLQHALNGGEYHIKELGYWVDGYDKEKNIVVEYNEKYHNRPYNINRDLNREFEIINYLHPNEFWKYNEFDNTFIKII